MITITKEELDKLPVYIPCGLQTKTMFIRYNDDTILKIYPYGWLIPNHLVRNIPYLIDQKLDNCCYPNDLCVIDNQLLGYAMPLIKNAKTWRQGVYDHSLTLVDKVKIITEAYLPIKQLHAQNKIVHNVHLRNFIYQKEEADSDIIYHGYLTDIDDMFFSDENETIALPDYDLIPSGKGNEFHVPTMHSDNIKATIAALSLICNIDYEELLIAMDGTISIDHLLIVLKRHIDHEIYPDIEHILTDVDGPVTYFDEIAHKFVSQKQFHR